jgi:hypothetical protein
LRGGNCSIANMMDTPMLKCLNIQKIWKIVVDMRYKACFLLNKYLMMQLIVNYKTRFLREEYSRLRAQTRK